MFENYITKPAHAEKQNKRILLFGGFQYKCNFTDVLGLVGFY